MLQSFEFNWFQVACVAGILHELVVVVLQRQDVNKAFINEVSVLSDRLCEVKDFGIPPILTLTVSAAISLNIETDRLREGGENRCGGELEHFCFLIINLVAKPRPFIGAQLGQSVKFCVKRGF